MKTILCYGDSNTWGYAPNQNRRYASNERWPGILQALLGNQYPLIEEGLPGRTTVLDDPFEGAHKNGETYLLPCLESHHPDLVIIVLGTNDLKQRFDLSADDVAEGAGKLVKMVQGFNHHMMRQPPEVLLIAPPRIQEVGHFADMFAGAEVKSKGFSTAFAKQADVLGCGCIDAADLFESCPDEGIHWRAEAHQKLAEAIHKWVLAWCAEV